MTNYIELPERRARRGRHYSDGNGRYRFEAVAGTDLHYETPAGLEAVDMRPARVNNAQFDGWRVIKNGWHYAIGQPADKGSDGWIGFGGRAGENWFLFRLARAGFMYWPTKQYTNLAAANYDRASLSRVNDYLDLAGGQDRLYVANRAEWGGVMPGVTLSWRAEGRGLKEEITVSEAAQAAILNPVTPADVTYFCFVFEIDAAGIPRIVADQRPKTISAGFETENEIQFYDAEIKELIAFMPLDYVTVETGEAEPARLRLRRRFYHHNGKDYLIIGARVDRLAALPPGPWVFDPSFSSQPAEASGKDTYIDDQHPTTNYGNSTGLHWQEGGTDRRVLIEFDCSSIPVDAVTTSAALQLTSQSIGYLSSQCQAHHLTVYREAWSETQATWNVFNSGNNWTSAGCNQQSLDYDGANPLGDGNGPGAGDTAYEIALDNDTSIINGWFGATNTNYGIRVSAVGVGYCNNHSSNAATAAYRPKLIIEYAGATPDPATATASAAAPVVVLGSVTVAPAAASATTSALLGSVAAGSVPTIVMGYMGNIYLMSAGAQVSVMLLTTAGDKWRLLESGGDVQVIAMEIYRYRGYLTPE